MTGLNEQQFFHDKIEQIAESIAKLNTQMATLIQQFQASERRHGEHERKTTDHEERLRVLEKWKDRHAGIFSVVTFILGGVVVAIAQHFLR